jgi:hypothetical protein
MCEAGSFLSLQLIFLNGVPYLEGNTYETLI